MRGDVGDLVDFAVRLRAAGLVVEHPRLLAAARALTVSPRLPDPGPYWPLRLTLCARHADLATFDAVYAGWRAGPITEPPPVVAEVAAVAGGTDGATVDGAESPDGRGGAAHSTDLTVRDIRDLTEGERAEVARLIAGLRPATRRRRAARWRPARRGRIDVAGSVRSMGRGCGEPTPLRRRRRAERPRRLLLLIDISKSMQGYGDALLLFAHAAVAAGPDTTEVFTIGTRWTRVTDALRARDPQAAMHAVSAVETDWHQGTELGRSLRSFLRRWAGHRAVRSAIVVIGSDGLDEGGDPALLPRQVARLSRLAHRLIWVNPQQRRPGYRPLDPGLLESLSHADRRLTGHTLSELRILTEAIAE